jgi:hypothetical protein
MLSNVPSSSFEKWDPYPQGDESKIVSATSTMNVEQNQDEANNKTALCLILTYLSLSESLNQTIGSSPHNLMLLGQMFPGYFSSLSHS